MSKFNSTFITLMQTVSRAMSSALVLSIVTILCIFSSTAATAQTTVTYFHNDIAGSPMVATNAAGSVVWKASYRPYGDRVPDEFPTTNTNASNKIGYAGSPFDASTGLSYMGARYYDPVIGRFMGIDPVGFQEDNIHSFNRYAYANNNPYKYVDRDGRTALTAIGIGVIAIGSVFTALQPPEKQQALATRLNRALNNVFNSESSELKPAGGSKSEPKKGADKPANPADIVAPGGVPVGENIVGAKPGVQTVSPEKLTDIIDRLKGTGAVPDSNSSYPGDRYILPGNQGSFGIRDSRDNGRTVDVNIPGVRDVTKIHER